MTPRPLAFPLILFLLLPPALAQSDDAAEKLILATYKLANETSTATGTVVCYETADGNRKCVIVTADHVLTQMKGNSCVLVSRSRNGEGYQRQEIRVPIRSNGKPLWSKHAEHDLAVLPLPDSVKVDALPFESLATENLFTKVHTGDAVWLAVFPERSEANDAGFPILRNGSFASYPITPVKSNPAFLVDTTSWKGDSGGPVIHQSLRSSSGGPIMVGIIRGMRNITDTVKESRFVERKTDYPLGITEVLHVVLAREMISQIRAER